MQNFASKIPAAPSVDCLVLCYAICIAVGAIFEVWCASLCYLQEFDRYVLHGVIKILVYSAVFVGDCSYAWGDMSPEFSEGFVVTASNLSCEVGIGRCRSFFEVVFAVKG